MYLLQIQYHRIKKLLIVKHKEELLSLAKSKAINIKESTQHNACIVLHHICQYSNISQVMYTNKKTSMREVKTK